MANASGGGGGKGGAIRAGKAFVELSAEDAGLRSGLEKARKAVLGFGKGLAVGGAGVAGVGALITGPILGAMHEAVDRFNEVRKAADQLGTTPEIFSGLAFAVKRFGIDSDGLVVASRHMNKFIAEAKDGGGAADDLNKLGLSAADLINLPLDEQFKAIASGIAALGTEAERQEATLKVFGRSGGALAPLMRGGAAGIADLLAKAKDIGAIVTKEDADNAKKFSGSLKLIKASIGFLIESVGASVLPEMAEQMKTVADNIVPLVKSARLFIEENRALVVGVLAVGTAITAAGTGLVMLGSGIALAAVAAGGLATALSVAGTVLAVVFSPVGLGVAALGVAAVMVAALVAEFGNLSEAAGTLKFIWGGLSETFSQTWAGIRDALKAGDLQLAFKVAVAGLDVIWKGYLVGTPGRVERLEGNLPRRPAHGSDRGPGDARRDGPRLRQGRLPRRPAGRTARPRRPGPDSGRGRQGPGRAGGGPEGRPQGRDRRPGGSQGGAPGPEERGPDGGRHRGRDQVVPEPLQRLVEGPAAGHRRPDVRPRVGRLLDLRQRGRPVRDAPVAPRKDRRQHQAGGRRPGRDPGRRRGQVQLRDRCRQPYTKLKGSGDFKAGASGVTGQMRYMVVGGNNQDEAFGMALNASSPLIGGIPRGSIDVKDQGGGVFIIEIEYSPVVRQAAPSAAGQNPQNQQQSPEHAQPVGAEFSFSTKGGTQRIYQSRFVRSSTALQGLQASDPKGRIGDSKHGTEGVDIVAPKPEFTINVRSPR
jgi:hypothetical protein